jgi:Caspase domain
MLLRLALFVLVLLLSSAAHAQKRVALVIGNSAYRHASELTNPRHDATDMAAALKTFGFQVIDGLDLDKLVLERKIREFSVALEGAEVGVFFYAGHGLQVSGQNYLVPIDAELMTAEALDFETVRLDLVQRNMERTARTNIVFLDACRNNPFTRNLARAMGTRSGEIGRGLAAAESGLGTLISFSTQPGHVALDGTGRNSPFTGALVRHMSSSSNDLNTLLIAVRNDVVRETQGKQVPWEHSALMGQFYFAKAPGAVPLNPKPPVSDPAPQASGRASICSQEFELKIRNGDLPADADVGGFLRWCLGQLTSSDISARPPIGAPVMSSATSDRAKICSQEFELKMRNGDLPANSDSRGYIGWCLNQ